MISQKRLDKHLYWDKAYRIIQGCDKVSEGCRFCWSESEAHMRSKNPAVEYQYSGVTDKHGSFTGDTRVLYENFEIPLKRKKSTTYAIWNDLFHPSVSNRDLHAVFEIMNKCQQHLFLVLTKRPERMKLWIHKNSILPNIGLGVTGETQRHVDDRVRKLLEIRLSGVQCWAYFVSIEPILGYVNIRPYLKQECSVHQTVTCACERPPHLDWVIAGAETGAKARVASPEWFRFLQDVCMKKHTPFFLKQVNRKKDRLLDGSAYKQFPMFPFSYNT